MKIKKLLFIAASVACLLATVAAQNKVGPDGNPVPVSVTDEPHHSLLFENEFVRAFDVTLPGMKQTLWYTHPYDFVEVVLSDGTVATGKLAEDGMNTNTELYRGFVRFRHGPTNFRIANKEAVGSYRSITIEVKKNSDQPHSAYLNSYYASDNDVIPTPTEWDKSFAQTLDRDTVRIADVQVLPKEEWKSHLGKMPYMVVAVSDVDLVNTSLDDAMEFKAPSGGVQWTPQTFLGAVRNVGDKPARFVVIELK